MAADDTTARADKARTAAKYLRQRAAIVGRAIAHLPAAYRLGQKYEGFTMIPRLSYMRNVLLAYEARRTPGCVVECGVWRGGMSAGLAEVFGPDRRFFLFDSFEGLPQPGEVDGPEALASIAEDDLRAEKSYAEEAMARTGARHVTIVPGWFDQTVTSFVPPEPIALLRLDGDWYDSIRVCLDALGKHMAPGGLIVVDDYFGWDGCARAVHDFLAGLPVVWRIQTRFDHLCVIRCDPPLTTG